MTENTDSLLDKIIQTMKTWAPLALGIVGCLSVAAGLYDRLQELPLYTTLLAMATALFSVWKLQEKFKGREFTTFATQLEGPLAWIVLAWMIFRVMANDMPQAVILPAIVCAGLAATCSLNILLLSALAAIFMETGLLFSSTLTINNFGLDLFVCAVSGALAYYAGNRYFKGDMPAMFQFNFPAIFKLKPPKIDPKVTEEQIKELGLYSSETSLLGSLPPLTTLEGSSPYSRMTVDNITTSFDLQLELMRRTLDLTTVAVLWQDPDKQQLRLRNLASSRADIDKGPYQIGSGITGGLSPDKEEISMAPVPASYSGIPYYQNSGGVGGVMLMRIPDNDQTAGPQSHDDTGARKVQVPPGILCVDRVSDTPWTDQDKAVVGLAARKLSLDVSAGRRLLNMDRERSSIQRLCLGLRELNRSLGLQSVFGSTIRAVKALAPADFIAISLLDKDKHRTVCADGRDSDGLVGSEYDKGEGLVGQVLKANTILPAGCRYRGAAPIFDQERRFDDFHSLIILPLRNDEGEPMGALTVASTKENIFTPARRDILELIAEQVAIKIDLGKAHEQINQMAITDGLTGLANHRTFQHAFDIMISRAQRNHTPICLVMCDLDHFKNINDTYGHPFGDKVLKSVAKILTKSVRAIDCVARYGGEEFALILEDSNEKGGPMLAERIRKEIESFSIRHGEDKVRFTISMGLAVYPRNGEEKSQIIERADQALYHAKKSGRNRLVVWSTTMDSETEEGE